MATAAALRAGKAIIELSMLTGPIEKQLRSLEGKLHAFGDKLSSIGKIGLSISGAVAAPFAAAIKLASDAAESTNKFNAVFASQAEAADKFAQEIASTVGRSKTEIQDAMSAFQGFFVGLGFAPEKARALSQQMQALSLDFASFHNLSDQESMERFISALSGSSEVLDKFGINIKQVALQEELLSQGVKKAWTEVTEQEKSVARLNIIMKSMTAQGAVGDAVKTAGSFANQMKALRAKIRDTAIEIGTALLPVATKWLGRTREIANNIAKWVSNNHQLFITLATTAVKVVAVSVAMIALGKAIAAVTTIVKALRVAITLLAANPMVALATLLGAVALATAHWAGWLEPVYNWLAKITGLSGDSADQVRELTDAMKEAGQAAKELTLDEKIAAKEKEIRDSEFRARKRREGIDAIQERAGRTGEVVPPGSFERLKNEEERLAKLKAELQQLKPKVAEADDPLGFGDIAEHDKMKKPVDWVVKQFDHIADRMTATKKSIADAIVKAEKLLAPKVAVAKQAKKAASTQDVAKSPEALFDTTFAKQIFGATRESELDALRKIERNTRRKQMAGIPVV